MKYTITIPRELIFFEERKKRKKRKPKKRTKTRK